MNQEYSTDPMSGRVNVTQIKLTPQLQDRRLHQVVSFPDKSPSRNNLRGPMENARVERRQFHSMSFGQFGKVQIGKLSARFSGDDGAHEICLRCIAESF